MILLLRCNTCGKVYEAEISENKDIIYQFDNKRIRLQKENEDCYGCDERVKQAIQLERQKIREELHGTK